MTSLSYLLVTINERSSLLQLRLYSSHPKSKEAWQFWIEFAIGTKLAKHEEILDRRARCIRSQTGRDEFETSIWNCAFSRNRSIEASTTTKSKFGAFFQRKVFLSFYVDCCQSDFQIWTWAFCFQIHLKTYIFDSKVKNLDYFQSKVFFSTYN